MTFHALPCIILFSILLEVHAQSYLDVLKIDHAISFGQKFNQDGSKARLNESSLDLTIPLSLPNVDRNKFVLISGLYLDRSQVDLFPNVSSFTLLGGMLKLGFNTRLSSRWKLTGVALPKIHTEIHAFSLNSFQIGGITSFRYDARPNLVYKFGLYANTDFFGPFLVPIAGLYIKKKSMEVNVNLPLNADINYTVNEHWRCGVRYSGFNKSYQVARNRSAYLEKNTNEAGPYVQINNGAIHLQLFAGYSFLRHFDLYRKYDRTSLAFPLYKFNNDRTPLNPSFNNGLIIRLSLILRISSK